jgi:hypothetical protein
MNADTTAELRKLAHALGVDGSRLAMLEGVAPQDLHDFRKQIAEALFQADKHFFARIAALSRAVPGAVAAKLTEAVLPPVLAARTAELIEPKKAADLVGRISDRYLADVSVALDASRCPEVIRSIPPERIATVGAELAKRKEWVVIGSFVAVVTDEALQATVARFSGEELLRISLVLEDLSRLDQIVTMTSEAQTDQLLAAAADLGLWVEMAELLEHVGEAGAARLKQRYQAADQSVRDAFGHGDLAPEDLAKLG